MPIDTGAYEDPYSSLRRRYGTTVVQTLQGYDQPLLHSSQSQFMPTAVQAYPQATYPQVKITSCLSIQPAKSIDSFRNP